MADIAGTNQTPTPLWKTGEQFTAVGKHTVASDLSSDTLTFTDLLPTGDKFIVDAQIVLTGEIDSNGTPTGDVELGDGSDADGYIKTQLVSGEGQLAYHGDGALIGTTVTTTDVVATFTALATAVTSGVDIFVKVTYICGLNNDG